MAKKTLESIAEAVIRRGPDRVVYKASGDATTSRDARERLGVKVDIVFLRGDGWTLGAPQEFERVAYRMWMNEWVGFMRRPNTTAQPITEYWSA